MVCLAQPIDEKDPINTKQSVMVRWAYGETNSGFQFIHKPNPEIDGIRETVATLRCCIFNYVLKIKIKRN